MAGYSVTYTVVDQATKQIDAINKRIAQMRAPMDRMSRSVARFVDVSGLRKVATGFESIFKAAGSVLRTLTAILPVMGALTGAASIAGMVKLVESYSNWAHELVQTADNLGMTTQEVQQLQNATRLAGGNADDMTNALKSLYSAANDARRGMPETAAWFNRLGIAWNDSNGHLRSMSDLLPEVMRKIAAMPNASDRAAASAALLGDGNLKLIETFRQSSQSFAQWFADAGRYKNLTDEQKRTLQAFTEAQGKSGVAFDQLGQQISITLAKNFTPLINHLTAFVEKNTPDILRAVDDLSKRFASWLENINWQNVQDGINAVIADLDWMIKHLDTIMKVGAGIASLFVIKWGVDVVRAIAAVTEAIGSAAGIEIAGVGLLGALGGVAAMALALKGDAGPGAPGPATPEQKRDAATTADDINKRQGYTGNFWHDMGVGISRGAGAVWDRIVKGPESIRGPNPIERQSFTPTAPELTPEGKGLLTTLASYESKGDYGVLYGGGHFTGDQFPQWAGRDNSHAAGAYQFQPGTFADVQRARPDIKDFSPANQDRAAWYLAQRDYHARTGRDLTVDLKDPKQAQNIANTLQPTWTSTNKPGWAAKLEANLAHDQRPPQIATAAPAARTTPDDVPFDVPTRPPNGSVDVSITHKNPPPNSAVTATGSGNVNVAPVRVEQQDMASI